jgi:plasmid stability protein
MADVLVRDVPKALHEALKRRAKRNGRSLNAEVVAILDADIANERDAVEITNRLREIARRVKQVPGMPTPEQLIRWDRDHGHD